MQLQAILLFVNIITMASMWPIASGSPGPMFLSITFCKVQGFLVEWMSFAGMLFNAYIMAFL